MIIGVPGEVVKEETRVPLTPELGERFVGEGLEIVIASDAGAEAGWSDSEFEEVGCAVLEDRTDVFERADIVLQVQSLGDGPGISPGQYREEQVVIGLFEPYDLEEELSVLAERNVTAFALELMPRISRAQSMDALSSMASIGGYKSAVLAAERLSKMFPMQMTAAGTVRPAEVFVIGAGVAGLQAIATADRLGASVRAYDIRLEVKREVESLGADFVELDLETERSGDDEGYAREMDEEFYRQQRKELIRVVSESDVVITTAAIPGRPAPELVTTDMIERMDNGSVIVDVSAPTGGNCEPTRAGETVTHEGVSIIGPTNLPATVPRHASELYANNVTNFLDTLLTDTNEIAIDTDDEIINSTMLTHDGRVRNPHREDGREDESDDE